MSMGESLKKNIKNNRNQIIIMCLVTLVVFAGYKYGEWMYSGITVSEEFMLNCCRLMGMILFGALLLWLVTTVSVLKGIWKRFHKVPTNYIAYRLRDFALLGPPGQLRNGWPGLFLNG